MARAGRVAPAAVAVAILVLLVAVLVEVPARAAMNRAFGVRFQANAPGDILLRGNSLMTCPSSLACTDAINRTGSGNALNNNGFPMEFVDVDADPSTRSSSSADVSLPANSTVIFAGLYWSAYTAGPRTPPPAGTAKDRLLFKVPGDSAYRTVLAAPANPTNPVDGTSTGVPYVSFADVTSIVKAAGSGTYTGADIHAATGTDSYAAWSLVLAVRAPQLPQRSLTVFDGFGTIQNSAGDTTLDIPLTGLSTPPSGVVDIRLGAVVMEGDAGNVGDRFEFVTPANTVTALQDAANPPTNSFNSTVGDAGVEIPGRVPAGNTFGFDADVFESDVLLGNSATSATLRLTTGGETFFPAVATFVSNIYAPRLDVTRSASVLDVDADGRTRPGDEIRYTVDVENVGDTTAVDAVITDALPAGTAFVPGSIRVDGVPVSDAANGDRGEFGAGSLTVRVGSGPGGSGGSGGTLAPGASTRVTYQVLITAPFTAGGTVSGSTDATYADAGARTFATSSTASSTAVAAASADLRVAHLADPALVQGAGTHVIRWDATVTNAGPDAEPAPVLVETLPAGVTSISVTGATCSTAGVVLTCPLNPLGDGLSTLVGFTATLPAGSPDPSAATAAVSGSATDPQPADNSAPATVAINQPPSAGGDLEPLTAPDLMVDIDVLADDTDPDSGDVLAIAGTTQPAHGIATVVAGKIRYTLTDVTFVGTDSFDYTVCDGRSGCDVATVSVPVDDHRRSDLRVVHTADPATVQRGDPLTLTWTATVTNDGPQDEPSPVLVETLPAGVSAVTVAGATCTVAGTTYTCPLPALADGDSLAVTFTATLPAGAPDPSIAVAEASGSITDPDPSDNSVTRAVGVNLPPVATADSGALAADVLAVDVDALANDYDPDADPLTLTSVAAPAHGTAAIVDGRIRYTLTDYDFVGAETLTYTACDGRGGCSTATVTLAVADHAVADLAVRQVATPKLLQRKGLRAVSWDVTVRNAGPHPELGAVLVETLPDGATGIAATLAGCTVAGTVVTCPLAPLAEGDEITVSFTATLPEDVADPAPATARVSGTAIDPVPADDTATALVAVNTPPVADDDTARLPASALRVTVDARAGDTDADGDRLTISSVARPAHGTATLVDGRIRYTLTDLGFAGFDSFTYVVCDGRSGCDTATVTVRVANHGDAPDAVADRASTPTGVPVTVDVTGNDRDADGDEVRAVRITRAPEHGTASLRGGRLHYTPDAGYLGTDSVRYEACDASGLCDRATVTILVTSAPPIAQPDTAQVRPGGTVVVTVLGNDTDPDGDVLGSVSITRRPSSGTASVDADGRIRYQASGSAVAGSTVEIGYRTCDPTGACSEGTLVLTVAGSPVRAASPDLAYTGTDARPLALVALLLILAGGLVLARAGRAQWAGQAGSAGRVGSALRAGWARPGSRR